MDAKRIEARLARIERTTDPDRATYVEDALTGGDVRALVEVARAASDQVVLDAIYDGCQQAGWVSGAEDFQVAEAARLRLEAALAALAGESPDV